MGVSRKQSKPNFPKNKHFLPPDMHNYVCILGCKKCSFFGKFGVLCFWNTRFEIRPLTLLSTNRDSCSQMFCKINVLKNFAKPKTCNIYKKRNPSQVFHYRFGKTTFYKLFTSVQILLNLVLLSLIVTLNTYLTII